MEKVTTATGFVPTPEQKEAIAYRKGNLQIIACAGSGKTEAISRRVCSLIEEGVEPVQVIAFTFTERAAAGLQARIKKRIGESMGLGFLDRLGPMFIGTIHSYCLQMLQTHVPRYGNFDMLDENRLAGLLSREHKRIGIGKLGEQHWRPISEFLRNVDVVENELIDPARLKGTPFGEVFDAFSGMLRAIPLSYVRPAHSTAVRALEDPEVFERVHGPLRHLIVDEYQDINPAQERLIELLANHQYTSAWSVMMTSRSISGVARMFPTFRTSRSGTTPSRCHCRSTGVPAQRSLKQPMPSPRASSLACRRRCCHTERMAAHRCVAGRLKLRKTRQTVSPTQSSGSSRSDTAIVTSRFSFDLARTSGPPLIEALKDRGIPFRCAGRTGLFLQPEPTVMGKLYAWLSGNEWKTERYSKPEPVELDDVIREFEQVFNKGKEIKGLLKLLTDWGDAVSVGDTSVSLIRDYYRLLNLLGVHKFDMADPNAVARMGSLARFWQILADFEHVTRRARWVEEDGEWIYRGGQDRGEWYYKRLFNYLQYYALDAYEDFEGEENFDLDVVDILTIHKAKGLEWPVVFVPSLVKGRFPSKYAGQEQDWLLSEKVFPESMPPAV